VPQLDFDRLSALDPLVGCDLLVGDFARRARTAAVAAGTSAGMRCSRNRPVLVAIEREAVGSVR